MKKLMLFLIIGMFMISFASAWDFDNVKDYDVEKREVTITNAFGLGDDIAKIKLESNLNQMVGLGNQKVAEFTISSFDDYDNVFEKMEFFDKKDGNRAILRDFSYKYKVIIPYTFPVFSSCEGQDNKTCEVEWIRNETIDKVFWVNFNETKQLKTGNITLGIFTDVQKGDYIEWIPTFFGIEIDEWATWTASLNTDLISYYSLNETSGNMFDYRGGHHANCVNAPNQNVGGILSNGIDFDGTNEECETTNTSLGDLTGSVSFGGWFNSDANVSIGYPISRSQGNTGASRHAIRISSGDYECRSQESDLDQIVSIATDQANNSIWTNVMCRLNATHQTIFINGVPINATAWDGTHPSDSTPTNWTFGTRGDPSTPQFFNGQSDEIGIWDRALTDSEMTDLYNGGTGLTYISPGAVAPNVTLQLPINNFNSTQQTVNFNGNVTSANTITNVSLIINGTYNETNTSGINNTFYNFSKILGYGFYNWTIEICNIVDSCKNATTRNVTVTRFAQNSFTFNSTTLETKTESFFANITTNGTVPSSAKLIYNGSSTTATITNTNGNDYNLSATIDIPVTAEIKPHFWNVTVAGVESSSLTNNQTVNLTNFTHCVSQPLYDYINISFKNETVAEEGVKALVSSSTWYYWLGSGDVVKTLSFVNASENADYTFCLNGTNQTLNANLTMNYDNSISQQRTYTNSTMTLTNSTYNLTLFLLPTSEGQFVTFQVTNAADQVLSGVFINATRGGNLVSSGTTDAAGSLQFFLNPDFVHTFYFVKSGYTSIVNSFAPTQTSYTVNMGSNVSTTTNDYTRGITFNITPIFNSPLFDNSNYSFNFSLASSYWTVQEFGFKLKNTTTSLINKSLAANGGLVNEVFNVSGQSNLEMEYWWKINGSYLNASNFFVVLSGSGTGWSINNTITDFRTYLASGMFGMDNFATALIVFIVLLLSVGIMAFKYGLTSPTAISILIFTIVLFLDVGLNLMATLNPFGIPHFITIFAALIMASMLLRGLAR